MRAGTRRRKTRGSWARAPAASPRRPRAPSAATRMDSASARKSKPGTKAQSGEAGRTTPGLVWQVSLRGRVGSPFRENVMIKRLEKFLLLSGVLVATALALPAAAEDLKL